MTNLVELSGKIYNKKEAHTTTGKIVTSFGLSVWAGKKDSQNTYEFINCKMWDKISNTEGDKIIKGKLAFDTWDKDGKKQVRTYILVDSIEDYKFNQQTTEQASVQDNSFIDDELTW